MSITRDDFLRLLPAALGGVGFTSTAHGIIAEDGPRRIGIELSPRGVRQLASLSLPTLAVKLEMEGGTEGEWHAFLHRFDSVFHRGGG